MGNRETQRMEKWRVKKLRRYTQCTLEEFSKQQGCQSIRNEFSKRVSLFSVILVARGIAGDRVWF